MRLDPGPADEGGFNLAPLIDVVFLLLVFFLASTTFAREEVELDLELPEARSGEAGGGLHPLVVEVGAGDELRLNGRRVELEGLRQRLVAAQARDAKQEVEIRGDVRARFGLVARVFDACRAASLTRIAIRAEPEEGR